MKHLLTIILMAFILIGCSKDDVNNTIIGNWDWVESSGGFAGTTTTPQTTGDYILLVISGSSTMRYINGNLISNLTYAIQTRESIFGGQREMIITESTQRSFELREDGNVLVLFDECSDCYVSKYVRVAK